jgi:hypothetical protein
MDLDDFDELFLILAYKRRQQHQRVYTGQPGQDYIKELLDSGHPERVHHILRMQLDTFYALRDWLVTNTDLKGHNVTQNQRIRGGGQETSVEEKLAIFIYIVSRPASIRDTSDRFSKGKNTITE